MSDETTAARDLGRCMGSGMPTANGACCICGHWPTIETVMPEHGETIDEAGDRRRWCRAR